MSLRPEAGQLLIPLDRSDSASLHRQLYEGLRLAILEERLKPLQRLPASRALANDLGVARGTVLLAYEQLKIEGYVTARQGGGTYVADLPPEHFLQAPRQRGEKSSGGRRSRPISDRAQRWLQLLGDWPPPPILRPFKPGLSPFDAFPRSTFARIGASVFRSIPQDALGYSEPGGYGPLRQAIADYLGVARGVSCTSDQVIVTSGSQHALSLVASVLLDDGEEVWAEEPGYFGANAAFIGAGLRPVPVPLDEQGLVVEAGRRLAPNARLACVTPSHQYPLGLTMSLSRRMELLHWAAERGAWVLEDDYDSEYRYAGAPLSSLYGLDEQGCVLYVGTFSKVLAPGIRVGYLVVPPGLAEPFARVRAFTDRHPPILIQAVLERFITKGHFGRHLRRMRAVGQARAEALEEALREGMPSLPRTPAVAGLHRAIRLPLHVDDVRLAERAAERGVTFNPLSRYFVGEVREPGMVLGHAAFPEREIRRAAARLAEVLSAEGALGG